MTAINFPNSPSVNDEFTAGTSIYKWNGSVWELKQSTVSVSAFSSNSPVMNGVASAGVSGLASRGDHVHPSDTAKASVTDLNTHTSATTSVHGITDSSNLVYTNDSRLTDSRTPLSHASSHGSLGSDPITIAQSQVTNLSSDLSAKAPLSSPTFTGTVTVPTPVNSTDATTKAYVDNIAQGLHVHAPSVAATDAPLATITGGTVTYNNGASGVGATLTLQNALTSLDGYSLSNGNRILIKNESNQAHNGIYTWATGGTVLTRATDSDTPTELAGGDFTFVQNGTIYNDTGWVLTDPVNAIGTDPVKFIQFSGAGTYTAGSGLSLNGTQFSINTAITADLNSIQTLTNKTINGENNTLTVRLANDITGFGTGVATFLATPTSANLISAITDETGSGSLVFSNSPTLTTPSLGVASATSINRLSITAPATSATLTIADGKTFTVSNTLTFTGTDSSSVAFGSGGTVVYTSGTTFTGNVLGVETIAPYSKAGTLAVSAGTLRFRFPWAATILGVSAAVNTAPTGASLICDVNKNGTTIFTTQSNRPTIAASGTATTSEPTPDVTSIAAGDYITVDIDQVGSTVAGADLSVFIRYKRA